MLLKFGLLAHKCHQPCDVESFSESLVRSEFALCPEARLTLCSVWFSPGHRPERQVLQASSVLPREKGYYFELSAIWFAPFFDCCRVGYDSVEV